MTGHSTALRDAVIAAAIVLAAAAGGPSGSLGVAWAQSAPDYAAIIAASDRSDADRQADKRRDPLPFLAFAGIRPGMKVLDMGAGGGYSTELVARAAGPSGVVYGQNPPDRFERARTNFAKRAESSPGMKTAVALLRPYDDPVPADVHDLDMITFLFFYHDTTYIEVDRAEMNRRLFAALKPGGVLIIADHAAKPGADLSVAKTLHRIDENLVRAEIEAAGFRFVAAGDFWRAPTDEHDFSTQQPASPVDNFVLKFEKPR
jgi:predicted methyltransferase